MAKRAAAGIVGAIAAVGSLLPLGYAFLIFKDFGNPDIPFWPNILGELIMCSIALTGLWIGIRLLNFSLTGRSRESRSPTRLLLLGIGFFFPACIFSIPLTIFCVDYMGPNDIKKSFLPFKARPMKPYPTIPILNCLAMISLLPNVAPMLCRRGW